MAKPPVSADRGASIVISCGSALSMNISAFECSHKLAYSPLEVVQTIQEFTAVDHLASLGRGLDLAAVLQSPAAARRYMRSAYIALSL